MWKETLIIVMTMLVAVLGPAIVIASVGQSVIKALARNPSAASKIFLGMVLLLMFVCAIAMIAILILFQLFAK